MFVSYWSWMSNMTDTDLYFWEYHENSTLNTIMYIHKYIAAILLLSHCDCLLQMCFFGLQKEKNIVKKYLVHKYIGSSTSSSL